jgi:hypothetical protein
LEVEGVNTGTLTVELCVDFEALEIADDEEGRVAEVFVVLVKLLVSFVEVSTGKLVLPGESVALPHVGKAGAAAHLDDVLFECVVSAHDVFFCGMGDTECLAEVAKMLLVRRLLSQLSLLPFDGEGCEVKRHVLAPL